MKKHYKELKEMKKILLAVLIISLLIGATACTATLFNGKDPGKDNINNGITYNKINYTLIEDMSLVPDEILALINLMEDKHYSRVFKADDGGQYVYIQLGARSSGGYGIKVTSVEDVEGRISIVYEEVKPEIDSINITVITYPYIILKIDSELPVDIRETIRSEQEAADLYELADDVNRLPADVQAEIKFYESPVTKVIRVKDEQYLLISLGTRPTGGYGINITDVTEKDGKLLVSYEEFKPGPDDMVTEALTSPWVVLKTAVMPAEFIKVK
jgi:hypothetical protein